MRFLVENFGLKVCGENHAQEFRDRYDGLTSAGARMDFIGHLQTNKVKYIAGKASLIHSLDSLKLAEEIDLRCKKLGTTQDVLIEVNIGEEESKSGVSPEDFARFTEEISAFETLKVRGMMTMAPKCEEKCDYLKFFEETYKLFLDIWRKIVHNNIEPVFSMGMSESFEEAIACGSTIVRIGRSFFQK